MNQAKMNTKSMLWLEHNNYPDYKRVVDLYDKYLMASREKDFHNAEHFNWQIMKIHERNGIEET